MRPSALSFPWECTVSVLSRYVPVAVREETKDTNDDEPEDQVTGPVSRRDSHVHLPDERVITHIIRVTYGQVVRVIPAFHAFEKEDCRGVVARFDLTDKC